MLIQLHGWRIFGFTTIENESRKGFDKRLGSLKDPVGYILIRLSGVSGRQIRDRLGYLQWGRTGLTLSGMGLPALFPLLSDPANNSWRSLAGNGSKIDVDSGASPDAI